MPRLLIVTTVAATLKAFLLPYARHFRSLGWRVDALSRDTRSCPECLDAFDECYEVPFSRNPLKLRGRVRAVEASIRALAGNYDIVHVHTPVASFVTRLALRNLETPRVVYTAHGFHFYRGGPRLRNAIYRRLELTAARWTDRLILINEEDYSAARFHFPLPAGHIVLMPGIGLDLSQWSRDARPDPTPAVREELGLNPGDTLFLMVAELIPRKRPWDALHALAKTGRRDFHLALAGDGPLGEEMKALARKLGIEAQAHFLGHREDVARLMIASLATVLPSGQEGLARSVMESIALGVPVLGADARGIRDLVTDSSRGTLYPVGRPAALAAAMLTAEEPRTRPCPDPAWDIQNLLRLHEGLYRELLL